MKVYVIYRQFYDPVSGQLYIGGIENYILALAELFQLQGYQVVVLQPARTAFTAVYAGIEVRGLCCGSYRGNAKKYALFAAVKAEFQPETDFVIFATDSYFVASDLPRTLAIQHGISWDKPGKGAGWLAKFKSWLAQRKYLAYVRNCPALVCVDHNFINWYRTFKDMKSGQFWTVIPNFSLDVANQAQMLAKWQEFTPPSLLIARRFVEYRGIPMACRVVQQLLARYPQLQVSFAGEGPLLPMLQQQFGTDPRVKIFSYKTAESLRIHLDHQLVLLPSIGSEGTSLSLAEAMAAGCAVVTTNVGGLSNMVLDRYNGLICMPDETELVARLSQLIESPQFAQQLAVKAWNTAQISFSKARWQQDWLQFLQRVAQPAVR